MQHDKSKTDEKVAHTVTLPLRFTLCAARIALHKYRALLEFEERTKLTATFTVFVLACFRAHCTFAFMHTPNCAASLITHPQRPQGVNRFYFSRHTHNRSHEPE